MTRRQEWTAGAAAALAVSALAFSNGGYYPVTWGWAAVVLFWGAAVRVLLFEPPPIGRSQWIFLGGLVSFVLWSAASSLWASGPTQPLLEMQRDLVYLGGIALVATMARGASGARAVSVGLLAAVVAASAYGLASRLFPTRFGVFDPIAASRLSEPLGYWNALGLFAAMGALLAAAFALSASTPPARGLAGAAYCVLA